MTTRLLAAAILVSMAVCPGSAQVVVSFPTEGHFKPGRYMPVSLTLEKESSSITLEARGAVPTQVQPDAGLKVVVPWLAVADSIDAPQWIMAGGASHLLDQPMHALGDNERLVALAGENGEIAGSLFPGKMIIPIRLDLSEPLLEPPQAWEALDAIVLSAAAADRLRADQVDAFLSAGTLVAVHSASQPAGRWPWKQVADYWMLRFDLSGPTAAIEPAAYQQTGDWRSGWPQSFRRRVLAAATVFSIVAVGLTLWRSRWVVAAFLLLCAGTIGGGLAWYARQLPVVELTGGVLLSHDSLDQIDMWSWRWALRDSADSFPAVGTRPVLESLRQLGSSKVRLVCDSAGRPREFRFELGANQSLAFLTRTVQGGLLRRDFQPPARWLKDFASALYEIPPNQSIAGQINAMNPASGHVAPIIVVRPKRQ